MFTYPSKQKIRRRNTVPINSEPAAVDKSSQSPPVNKILKLQDTVGNQAVGRMIQRKAIIQRAPEPAKEPKAKPGEDPGFLSADRRGRVRIELGDRIGDVARKWSVAINKAYTDKKTEKEGGFADLLFDALLTYGFAVLTDGVGEGILLAMKERKSAAFAVKAVSATEKEIQEFGEVTEKALKKKFTGVKETLTDTGKKVLKDSLKPKGEGDKDTGIVDMMSDLVGSWGQELRKKLILDLPESGSGDTQLIAAMEAFDEKRHPQTMYDKKVTELWEHFEKKVLPVLKGSLSSDFDPGGDGRFANRRKLSWSAYHLKVADIVIPRSGIHRPAVVVEFLAYNPGPGFYGNGFDPLGDYAFKEWVEAEDIKVLHGKENAKQTTAAKSSMLMGYLINRNNSELMEWFNEKKKENPNIEPD